MGQPAYGYDGTRPGGAETGIKRLATPFLAAGLFLLGVWLNSPLFAPGEFPFRGSIEGSYAATARFISEHPNPWGWNPLQYAGLPTQFLYLPGLPYATAVASRVAPSVEPEYLYRLLTAVLTCLGPVTVFLFALYFTGSRKWSLAAALAITLVSPAYGLFPNVEKDRGIAQLPWRIQVLAKYGEGPHNSGLTLMPLALMAAWAAGRSRRSGPIVTSAILLAAVTLTNWVSALALAMACLMLLAAGALEPGFRAWRVLAGAALAYLLACFWLTPTFIRTIAFNWPADAFGYQFRDRQMMLLAGLAASLAVTWLAFRWFRAQPYFCFVTLCALAYGWLATAFYVFGADTIPESRRYALEFEVFVILALVEVFRRTVRHPNQTARLCAAGSGAMLLLAGLPQLWAYVTQERKVWMPVPRETTVEYRLARWINDRHPRGRVFASGGLRFRLDTWFDLQQVGGGFESGLRNRLPVDLAYQIRTCKAIPPEREVSDTILMLKALAVEYVVIHGPKSKEYYRDYHHPMRLEGTLPVVYRENDDIIYALPPRGLANLINSDELAGENAHVNAPVLARYVAAREDTARPALRSEWLDPRTFAIDGAPPGRLVAVQETWDAGWKATQGGRDVVIDIDHLGFMIVHARLDSSARIVMRYEGTAEQQAMASVSVLAWLAVLGTVVRAKLVRKSG